MSNQPFIRQLTLRNLLSFGSEGTTIDLKPLNVLIGPNASGKSNFIEAIGVLRAATRDLTAPFKETGIGEWIWKGAGSEIPLQAPEIETVFAQPGNSRELRHCLALTEGAAGRTELVDESLGDQAHPRCYFGYEGGHPIITAVDPEADVQNHFSLGRRIIDLKRENLLPNQSILSQKNDPAFYPEISYLAKQLGAISIYRQWDTGLFSPIRTPSRADDPKSHLADDASNLALVLNNLLMHSETRGSILEHLKSFYDRAEDVAFDIYANRVQLRVREAGFATPISSSRLSDGTVRFLALLAVVYDPAPPPVICIEEPELGMHPHIIPIIAEMLIEASERTQLIVTTHSDFLISKLRDMPEAIVVCDWSESGTTLRRLTTEDVDSWDDASLGDIWLKGGFGGTRW